MTGAYIIPLFGLSEGHHTFDFEIGNRFFEGFAESEIKEGELTAVAGIKKNSSCIDITVRITGSVLISCDRCLDMYPQAIDCTNHFIVKAGQYPDDSDPDIMTIAPEQKELDMSQLFYEYIHLALPLRRVHPDNADGTSGCDPEMIEELNKHIVNDNNGQDSTWDDLKKLLNNN